MHFIPCTEPISRLGLSGDAKAGPVHATASIDPQFGTAVRALANGASQIVNRVPFAGEQLLQAIDLNLSRIEAVVGGSAALQPVGDQLVHDCRQWQTGRNERGLALRILQGARWLMDR